ncbi:MAG: hypothetical protein AB1390_07205 [Nitrospirota bacterium]
MPESSEKIPLDARLLSDAIIELNISRRNVAIYPKDHPSVEKSLGRAFEFLQKLFELRAEITLAVAKDTLIIDDYYLDRKNPVYKEFALHLSKLNIAYVTFICGLTKDELYEFHKLISEKATESPQAFQEKFEKRNMIHIRAGFIDYGAFHFEEGKKEGEVPAASLWERYVYGLLEGTLQSDEVSDEIRMIPPEVLAKFLNKTSADSLKEESYDKVITTYIRRSSETTFSGPDLKRLMEFINGLRPELKKQFLSSAVKTISTDLDQAFKVLKEISVDDVIDLLSTINEQKLVIPEALKNLLDKLSKLPQRDSETLIYGSSLVVDDIFLSPDIVSLFNAANFKSFITDEYQKEIQKILSFDPSKIVRSKSDEIVKEYDDVYIDKNFNQIILEVLSSAIVSDEEYSLFINMSKEQAEQFVWTGQFGQVYQLLQVLINNLAGNIFAPLTSEALDYYHSSEFLKRLVDAFRIVGRAKREEAWILCNYYGERIIPFLMDALSVEDSQTVRKFLLGLLRQMGDRVIPEAIRRLGDSRWFIKRNMIYILSGCSREVVLPHIRPYCRHENRKVSFEAIKCLLNAGDVYGIEALKEYLRSNSREEVEMAISLAGSFRIRDSVADLVKMLGKRGISGADLYDKIPVVKALGEIGDTCALEALKELLSEKSFVFKGAADRLKEEVYRSLKNYPPDAIKDFIKAGLKSKNDFIREESMRLDKKVSQ